MLLNMLLSNHDHEVLTNFYRLSSPPQSELDKRDAAVKEIINKMGHKYCLSRSMPRIS